jgi:hypothetical protein
MSTFKKPDTSSIQETEVEQQPVTLEMIEQGLAMLESLTADERAALAQDYKIPPSKSPKTNNNNETKHTIKTIRYDHL